MKTFHLPLLALLIAAPLPTLAADLDLPVDERIRVLTYAPSDVYTVPTKYGYQTSIVFAPGEVINTVSVGDRSMWQIVPSGSRIFIRPMDDGLKTNMTVITSMREYNFDILSVESEKAKHLYSVQFRYPSDKKRVAPGALDEPPPVPDVVPLPSKIVGIPPLDTQRTKIANSGYTYSGEDAIAPIAVEDNGRITLITYENLPKPAPVPMVFADDGKPVVASHRVEGNRIIMKQVAPRFVLSGPSGDITVYNESYVSRNP